VFTEKRKKTELERKIKEGDKMSPPGALENAGHRAVMQMLTNFKTNLLPPSQRTVTVARHAHANSRS
jgi:hypothetical protein